MSGAIVGVGAAAAEGCYRDDDDVWVGGTEGWFIESNDCGVSRRLVVDDHVDAGDELAQQIAAGRVVEVEGDGLFAGVEVQVQAAALGMGNVVGEGPATPGRVAAVGGFGLDDPCP